LLIFAGLMLCCGSGIAGPKEGTDAFVKGDYVTALKELRPLAERGNAKAQYRLGRMYEFGQGVVVDKAQALVWLRKSAAQGDAEAQLELGVMYATGDGVKQDDKMAVELFQKAATQGEATAQYNLGLMYAKGNGVQKDYAQAVAWFRKAAEQGDVRAQFKLGWCTNRAKAWRRTTFSLSPITRSPRVMGMQRRLRSGIMSARR
jgi:hypothetical protein